MIACAVEHLTDPAVRAAAAPSAEEGFVVEHGSSERREKAPRGSDRPRLRAQVPEALAEVDVGPEEQAASRPGRRLGEQTRDGSGTVPSLERMGPQSGLHDARRTREPTTGAADWTYARSDHDRRGRIAAGQRPDPEPGPDEVLIRSKRRLCAALICRSCAGICRPIDSR